MKKPMRVAVTGAAGQIGYSLLFRIASGEMLGKDQPVILQLLEIPDEKAQKALKGVMMELDDCAFPLLRSMAGASDPKVAFRDTDVALLVGARPRGPGMERKDLLEANGAIFTRPGQGARRGGRARREGAGGGQPRQHQRADRDEERARAQAHAVHRDDAPGPQPLAHAGRRRRRAAPSPSVEAHVDLGQPLRDAVSRRVQRARRGRARGAALINDQAWIEGTFIPTVQKRGAAIIEARGLSSAASAANAAIDHVRDWVHGHSRRTTGSSMGVPSEGSYGIAEGLMFGFPVRCSGGRYEIVQGLEHNDFAKAKIAATRKELTEERAAIEHLLK